MIISAIITSVKKYWLAASRVLPSILAMILATSRLETAAKSITESAQVRGPLPKGVQLEID